MCATYKLSNYSVFLMSIGIWSALPLIHIFFARFAPCKVSIAAFLVCLKINSAFNLGCMYLAITTYGAKTAEWKINILHHFDVLILCDIGTH